MININMNKAKDIAHEIRRAVRAEKFAPLDIKATIPSEAEQAEAERQAIREADAVLQTQMDSATTPEELKALLPEGGNA